MATHATVTLQIAGQELHANVLADGYPAEFAARLRALVDSVSLDGKSYSGTDLKEAFFSPIETFRADMSPALRGTLGTASETFEPADYRDQLGDAWYRYELQEGADGLLVRTFVRNTDAEGIPSLRHGWREAFRGNLTEFLGWARSFGADEESV